MVITSRTQTTLFTPVPAASPDAKALIRLPLSVVPHYEKRCEVTGAIIPTTTKPLFRTNLWNSDEHERFLRGLEIFPKGPWKEVAKVVGTKTTRQTMTHAQKYRQKILRHMTMPPKQPTTKSRQRKLNGAANQHAMAGHPSGDDMTQTLGLAATPTDWSSTDTNYPVALASPMGVQEDVFDVSFLDKEFESILASFGLVDDQSEGACVTV